MTVLRSSHIKLILRHRQGLINPCNIILRTFCNSKKSLGLQNVENVNRLRFVSTCEVKELKKEGFISRVFNKIPYLNIDKNRLKLAGYLLYEGIVDHVDYVSFMEEFDMPDTFYSWFVITELYIWMLSTRVMAEENGKLIRNSIVAALWTDVEQRVKKLGAGSITKNKQNIIELSEQLQATLIAYDEGLQSDDVVLAGALWRRFYQIDHVHVHNLERLVQYVRKQVAMLDNVSSHQLCKERLIIWESATIKSQISRHM